MLSTSSPDTFLDAGLFVGALLRGDARYAEALPIVEAARAGRFPAATTMGVLSEVYAALTWSGTVPNLSPADAAEAIRRLISAGSAIRVIGGDVGAMRLHLQLAAGHRLAARAVHDARHAAIALAHGITEVYTYDLGWRIFAADGLQITGPPSILAVLSSSGSGGPVP